MVDSLSNCLSQLSEILLRFSVVRVGPTSIIRFADGLNVMGEERYQI